MQQLETTKHHYDKIRTLFKVKKGLKFIERNIFLGFIIVYYIYFRRNENKKNTFYIIPEQ